MADAPTPKSGSHTDRKPASPMSKTYAPGIHKSGPTQLSDGALSESESGSTSFNG